MESPLSSIVGRVQANCALSDALYGGVYSLCSLLLRMRDLYKWEHGLQPWQEPDPPDLLEWIESREDAWLTVEKVPFNPVEIDGSSFSPFDVEAVNAVLRPRGYVYGAGYGTGMKPTFFLGELVEQKTVSGLHIDVVGRELARDLFTSPAMRQGDHVLTRTRPMESFLWDQILEMRPSATDGLVFGLARHGLDLLELRNKPSSIAPDLGRVARTELESWIYHEIGEAAQDAFNGHSWHTMVSTYAGTPVEIFARVIKDLLADTHDRGLLGYVIEHRIESTLGFYVAFLRAFTRLLFPEIRMAFSSFRETRNWDRVEEARKQGYTRARRYAEALVEIQEESSQKGNDWGLAQIKKQLIEPLGIPIEIPSTS
ncbi:MAG: Sfum_1244 family protein [Syntrophobacteraceae bacterium]